MSRSITWLVTWRSVGLLIFSAIYRREIADFSPRYHCNVNRALGCIAHQHCVNGYDFNLCLKTVRHREGSLKSSGRLFQRAGPEGGRLGMYVWRMIWRRLICTLNGQCLGICGEASFREERLTLAESGKINVLKINNNDDDDYLYMRTFTLDQQHRNEPLPRKVLEFRTSNLVYSWNKNLEIIDCSLKT